MITVYCLLTMEITTIAFFETSVIALFTDQTLREWNGYDTIENNTEARIVCENVEELIPNQNVQNTSYIVRQSNTDYLIKFADANSLIDVTDDINRALAKYDEILEEIQYINFQHHQHILIVTGSTFYRLEYNSKMENNFIFAKRFLDPINLIGLHHNLFVFCSGNVLVVDRLGYRLYEIELIVTNLRAESIEKIVVGDEYFFLQMFDGSVYWNTFRICHPEKNEFIQVRFPKATIIAKIVICIYGDAYLISDNGQCWYYHHHHKNTTPSIQKILNNYYVENIITLIPKNYHTIFKSKNVSKTILVQHNDFHNSIVILCSNESPIHPPTLPKIETYRILALDNDRNALPLINSFIKCGKIIDGKGIYEKYYFACEDGIIYYLNNELGNLYQIIRDRICSTRHLNRIPSARSVINNQY